MVRNDNEIGDMEAPPPPMPAPDYSRAYDALGGAESVNALRNTFLQMGLDENTIGSVFSAYYAPERPASTPITPAPVTPTTITPEPAVSSTTSAPPTGLASLIDTTQAADTNQAANTLQVDNTAADATQSIANQTQAADTTQMGDLSGSAFPNWQQEQALRQQEVEQRILANDKTLSGNIMAGASWHSLNPTLADELTQATGQQTFNTAVGGATTSDTLQQLNDFMDAGGKFAPGSNLILQQGGLDFVYGVDKNQTLSNLDQIISEMEKQGVSVVLAGSPYASSFEDVQSNNFDPALDEIYNILANKHSNVTLVDSMGKILQDKSLLADPIHPNKQGWEVYNQSILDAIKSKRG